MVTKILQSFYQNSIVILGSMLGRKPLQSFYQNNNNIGLQISYLEEKKNEINYELNQPKSSFKVNRYT